MADELFRFISSSAKINKNKRKKPNENKNYASEIAQQFNLKKNESQETQNSQFSREELAAFRNRLKIKLADPTRAPPPITTFDEFLTYLEKDDHHLTHQLLVNIENGKWKEPTPIQMQTIPGFLKRKDVLGMAPTGSGKSGAFIIPAILYSIQHYVSQHSQQNNKISKNLKQSRENKQGIKRSQSTSKKQSGQVRCLLLAPSRELASQLHREVQRLTTNFKWFKSALLSSSNKNHFINGKLGGDRGLDVLVSTPLRLNACLQFSGDDKKIICDLSHVQLVVLDEADRLLDSVDGSVNNNNHVKDSSSESGDSDDDSDSTSSSTASSNSSQPSDKFQQHQQSGSSHSKSFIQQIDDILSYISPTATRALFSATMGPNIRALAESILRDPLDVSVGVNTTGTANKDIDQKLVFVGREEGKLLAIRQMIQKGIKPPVMIFLQSKERAQALFKELLYEKVNVDVIHAGRSQAARDLAVQKFRRGETWVLITTDLVARGVDFKAVNLVINYDLPTSGVSYVHRIGRTGRMGRKGEAVTLFTESDFTNLRMIANVVKISGCDVPDWICFR